MAIARSLTALAGLFLFLGSTSAQAAPLQVTVTPNPTTCQNMTVSFDGTAGTAPWTITIAPLGHVPITVALPLNYSSDPEWSWNWPVPGYPTSSQAIVAVSDSTGRVSGTSAFARLTSAGRCSAPAEPLDFIWFPPTAAPGQCGDWPFTVQEDAGNSGMKMPLDMLIIPENDVPTRLRITNRQNNVDWTVNYPAGTNFAVAGYDAGPAGNGGVGGDVYTVGRGTSATCIGQTQVAAVAGLPPASSTAAALPASPTASRAPTSKTHGKATSASAQPSATGGIKNPIDASSSLGSNSGSSAGKIGGAVGGVLAAVTIVGLGIYFYRRNQANRGPDEYGVYPSTEKRSFFSGFGSGRSADRGGFLGGRIGASTDQQGGISPFVTGRASPWRWSSKPAEAPFARMNDGAASSHGHSSSISLHRGWDSYGGGIPMSAAPSVHSVVPDEALFPPPMPTNRNMMQNHAGYGAGFGAAGVGAGLDPFRNPSQPHLPSPPREDKPLPPVQQQPGRTSSQRQHPASRDSMAAIAGLPLSPSSTYSRSRDLTSLPPINQDKLDLSNMQMPPSAPVNTSCFDPYAHASRMYGEEEIGQPSTALERNEHRYADPKESAARFRTLDAQLVDERKKVICKVVDDDSDDEGGLPYM